MWYLSGTPAWRHHIASIPPWTRRHDNRITGSTYTVGRRHTRKHIHVRVGFDVRASDHGAALNDLHLHSWRIFCMKKGCVCTSVCGPKYSYLIRKSSPLNLRHKVHVGNATSYELDGRGSIPGRAKRFFSSPQRPDRLWSPLSLLHNGYRELLHRG
jgi:hypothetical protein